MKRNQKSALIRCAVIVIGLCGLAACDSVKNINWPHVYGPNEVPADIANAPRPVETAPPPPADTPYPRLGDVPAKPTNFSTPAEIDKTKSQMIRDRQDAESMRDTIQRQQ